MIYLDYNATTPTSDMVIDAVTEAMRHIGNPSSQHGYGKKAKQLLTQARQDVLRSADAEQADIIFTASGTEANNLAMRGLGNGVMATSEVEHPSVLEPAKELSATILPVDHLGIVDMEAIERWLRAQSPGGLLSIQLANSETGVIQPIEQIVQMARDHQAILHTDATQLYGKCAWSFDHSGADAATISAHKIGGPKGAAALLVKKGLKLRPLLLGGAQENYRRAGTENVPAIAGFGAAAKALRSIDVAHKHYIYNNLPNGAEQPIMSCVPQLPNTLSLRMPGVPNHTQLIHFDMQGIAVSNGSACSSGKVGASHVLRAMGLPETTAQEVLRVSYGVDTTREEIDIFLAAWQDLYARTQKNEDKRVGYMQQDPKAGALT